MLTDPTVLGLVGVLLAAVALTVGVVWSTRKKRDCPSCGLPLVSLGRQGTELVSTSVDGDPLTYEVLVCPRCTNAVTNVHGARSRYAYCPECRQRTLETPCIRLPDSSDARRRVEVHEACHLCGHLAMREVADPPVGPQKRGQVIQFPAGRRKHGTDDR